MMLRPTALILQRNETCLLVPNFLVIAPRLAGGLATVRLHPHTLHHCFVHLGMHAGLAIVITDCGKRW